MSKDNVQRFIARVSEDYSLAAKVKAIPAGVQAESAFVALAKDQGLDFTVDELRAEADRATQPEALQDVQGGAADGQSNAWVLDYFYGSDRKWTK